MRGERALQGLQLFGQPQRAGDDDDRHMRRDCFQARNEVGAVLALGQRVIEDNEVGYLLGQRAQRGGAGAHASEPRAAQRLAVKPQLLRIVFDDQDGSIRMSFHGSGIKCQVSGGAPLTFLPRLAQCDFHPSPRPSPR